MIVVWTDILQLRSLTAVEPNLQIADFSSHVI